MQITQRVIPRSVSETTSNICSRSFQTFLKIGLTLTSSVRLFDRLLEDGFQCLPFLVSVSVKSQLTSELGSACSPAKLA